MSQAHLTSGQSVAADVAAQLAPYRDQAAAAREMTAHCAVHARECADTYRAMRAATRLPQHLLAELGFPPPPPDTWALTPL